MARILITSAIPYINGIKHLGNLVGSQLPADLFARFNRAMGHEVMFICATDEHGTPAELAAAKAGKPVEDYCAEMHQVQAEIARGFRLSFDHFGRSSSQRNHRLTQHFAGKLAENGLIAEVSEKQVFSIDDNRFLPDRYITGTCPNCGYPNARGDQCENCTKQLDPTDLITAVTVPIVRGWQGYAKVGVRNAMVIATASVALVADADRRSVAISLGSVGPTVLRCPEAELLASRDFPWDGGRIEPGLLSAVADSVRAAARPIDDHRSSADYRRHAVGVLARRLLERAASNLDRSETR